MGLCSIDVNRHNEAITLGHEEKCLSIIYDDMLRKKGRKKKKKRGKERKREREGVEVQFLQKAVLFRAFSLSLSHSLFFRLILNRVDRRWTEPQRSVLTENGTLNFFFPLTPRFARWIIQRELSL